MLCHIYLLTCYAHCTTTTTPATRLYLLCSSVYFDHDPDQDFDPDHDLGLDLASDLASDLDQDFDFDPDHDPDHDSDRVRDHDHNHDHDQRTEGTLSVLKLARITPTSPSTPTTTRYVTGYGPRTTTTPMLAPKTPSKTGTVSVFAFATRTRTSIGPRAGRADKPAAEGGRRLYNLYASVYLRLDIERNQDRVRDQHRDQDRGTKRDRDTERTRVREKNTVSFTQDRINPPPTQTTTITNHGRANARGQGQT